MTVQEFSNEFDILYNNIASNQAPGLDEYEKSVFLTRSQEELVESLYNGNNIFGKSFEETEELRRCLSNLIITTELVENKRTYMGVSSNSKFYTLPEDLWFITYESLKVGDKTIEVIPVSQDNYHKIKNNPFKGASNKRALRLDYDGDTVEIVCTESLVKYCIKYIVKPSPIILEDLSNSDLFINNSNTKSECMLNTSLHRLILERAVQKAAASWSHNK